MRIAIFDYFVRPSNPSGGCHWKLLRALSAEHEFTVFAVDFENPDPERIRWVRIPAPRRPLALLFLAYHALAPLYYRRFCRSQGVRFDLVQSVESNLGFSDLCYSHFCHRRYLRRFWSMGRPTGLRAFGRWLDHRFHEIGERWIYRRVPRVVVPSSGLRNDLESEYPVTAGKVKVVHNPIDTSRFLPAPDFDRSAFRRNLGIGSERLLLVFVALGHFERKGLPALLEALSQTTHRHIDLLVVGGTPSTLEAYRETVNGLGLHERVIFAGAQSDVRPYFWSGDAFVLPSAYETFSLVTYEAAAAGLPLLVNRTSGIEDIVSDGENGMFIGAGANEITAALNIFGALGADRLGSMGARARQAVLQYSTDSFADLWRSIYAAEPVG